MAFPIPTTEELRELYLSNIETEINQTSPLTKKAFNRVLASSEALNTTPLFKFGAERAKQNLAISATGEDLNVIGENYGIIRKPAEAAVLTISLPAENGTIIPATTPFIGDLNGARYFPSASATAVGGVAILSVTAENVGVVGNLQPGDTLSIGIQIPGATTQATVDTVDNTGAEEELDDAYRIRILDEIRTVGGGGNGVDYRRWAQEVAGVTRAYPYSGRPLESGLTSEPIMRTVYVEADKTIDPDGIAPQSILDEVRTSITTNPITGAARQPLGLTDDTLFVESISRTGFYIQINNLVVNLDIESTVKTEIFNALSTYFRSIRPFIESIDSLLDRNDLITDLTVSEVAQNVLSANGGSATGIGFGLQLGVIMPQYQLSPGETSKLIQVTYV